MSRRIRKATPKEQLLRVQAAAAAMVASANESVPAERRVSARSTSKIVSRAFARTKNLTFSQRKYQSLRDVSDFIAMSHHGKSNYSSARNTDLLPVGNPISTRKNLMSITASSNERARWVAADPRIHDEEMRSLVASLLSSNPGSLEYSYYSSRISSTPHKSAPLVALIAAFGGGNSRAARSARARLQRRDRKGRFAWMGGGMSALVRRTGGGVRRLTGRFVAQGVGNDNTFDIEGPDGTLYRVPAGSSEAVKAVIPSDQSPDGFSPVEAKVTEGANVIDEADLVKIESPQGFRKDDTYTGPGTKYTDDAYDVIKFDAGDDSASDVGATDLVDNLNSDKPVFAVYRRDNPDSILGASQSWADSQAVIRADEPIMDEEEGREVGPVARLSDEEFDALNDDPDFDFDQFIKDQSGEEITEEEGDLYAAVQDLPNFEFKTPDGAYEPDLSSDYEPVGRTDQEAPNYTDDPSVLASMGYSEEELTEALSQALLGDDPNNPDGSGFGELDFDGGKEDVPAEALYEALYESGIDPDMAVAKIYDSSLGGNENETSLTKAREDLFGVSGEEEIAEIPEDEGAEKELPPAIEGASEDERNAYLESGDWTPFLQDNQDFEETGSYNLLDTEPYTPLTDEQRAEAELPDAVFDNPVDLANALSEEDLTNYLRESIEPDTDMPGLATISFEDEDGEIVEAYIPGEAVRDALQLQGVNTNEILDSIYSEPKEADGDKEPTDDEATEVIDSIELDGEEVTDEVTGTPSGYYSVDPDDNLDMNMEYDENYLRYLFNTDPSELTIGELSDLSNVINQISDNNKFLVSDVAIAVNDEIFRRADLDDPNGDVNESGYDGPMFVGEESFGQEGQVAEIPETPEAEELSPEDKFMDEFGLDIDMSTWVKDGGQAGSNEGAFYTDPATGMRYYVKKPKSAKHARNEALASAFYNEAGVRHGRIYIAKDSDGNEVLVSPIVQGDIENLGDTDWQNDPDILASAQNGFVMDAWLNNWDSVGMNYDNMIVKGKDVYRIDPGGALIFRAQGGDKSDTLTPEAQQIDDLRFKGKNASSVFGSMTDEQITEDAKKLVGISPERISELVDTAFADDPETRDFIKENLLARRQTIMDRFGLTEDDFPKGTEESETDVVDELPGDTPDNEEQIIEESEEQDENAPFTPDEPANLAVDSATGDYTPDMKALYDIFINNPEAAKGFLEKVKQEDDWGDYTVVDQLLEKIDKPEVGPEDKDIAEKASEEIVSDIVESTVDDLDDQDQDIIDLDLEKEEFEKIDLELEDLLDDEDLGSADKVIKKILETYEAKNNGDGTFTLNSVMRDGADGKPQKLELRIQKNKDNTFSVLFVQTTWDQDNDPLERVVDKYAPRHSFKALSNNIQRGKSWIATFEANDSLSVDKFMKLVSKNTYKKIAGDGAIDVVKATHISADGVTELKVGDRVYNWKNGKWGTVSEVLPEYFGQGKHKVKQITADGEEVYGYTDYLKVRWDDNPGKALPVVSGSVFQIDPETGYAVNNVVPTLYNSKGKPKPNQPKKPESPDPQNPAPASSAPEEPKLEPAPTPEEVDLPEPEPVQAPEEEFDDDINIQVTDEQAQDMIDEFGSVVGGIYNYKGEDVEILSMNKDGVTYKNVETGEEGNTPLVYWNQEELDGVVDSPKMDLPSDPSNPMIGDKWVYNSSDGTKTYMKLTGADVSVTYQYIDKDGKPKVKTISKDKFTELASSGKITPGAQRKISPKDTRELRDFAMQDAEPATGDVPEAAPSTDKTIADQNNDGSTPLEDFASVEDAVALVKERKKSGYQHRITYDGESISDMEIVMSAPTVDGTAMVGSKFRLKAKAADNLEQSIVLGDLVGWTEESGIRVPFRKRYKTGLRIKTDQEILSSELKYQGKTFTKTLPDGTQIRFYRDKSGPGFVFGDVVEVYSPNTNFGKSDLDEILGELGVSEANQSYATKDTLRTLGEKRLLEYFYTGDSEQGKFKNPEDRVDLLNQIEADWGVTPDSLVVEQSADGRMQLVFPEETVDRLIEYTGINGMYSTTGANSIATVLGGANPGMQSTSQRVFLGLFKTKNTSAMSQLDDMSTGGADFVYLRPIKGKNNPSPTSTRIFVDPREILKRLDIFAYPQDMWGVKNKTDYRWQKYLGQYGGAGQPEMLRQAADKTGEAPEIMVRHNVPLAALQGYMFNNYSISDALARLKDAGITHVNGIPVEEFLKNNSDMWYNMFKEASE